MVCFAFLITLISKEKQLIYSFQFGLRQKHLTTRVLVHLTENVDNSWMMVIMIGVFLSY